jgi:hypothetical protein
MLSKISCGNAFSPLFNEIGSPGMMKKSANINVTAAQTTTRL